MMIIENYKWIDTFEKALEVKGETLEQFNERTKSMSVGTAGLEKVEVIVFALNGGEHVKEGYWPYFYNPNRSSDGFSYFGSYCDNDGARVGARLLLKSRELSVFAGETFPKEYSQYINGTLD